MGRENRTCPNCGREYWTVLQRYTDQPIQVEYPDAPKWQREQLISGLCSDKCFKEFVGLPHDSEVTQ